MTRVIVYAKPEDYVLVGRVVRKVTDPAYVWPEGGLVMQAFQAPGQEVWEGPHFSIKRGKNSITIWGPQ